MLPLTPDYVVEQPWGRRFFRSEYEAVVYAKTNGFVAYKLMGQPRLRVLLYEPKQVAA